MIETPQLVIMIIMMLVVTYMAKSGVEALGKWSMAALVVVLLIVLMSVLIAVRAWIFQIFCPLWRMILKPSPKAPTSC